MNKSKIFQLLSVVIFFLFICGIVKAHFSIPNLAPVGRIIPNAEAYVKENPKDAHGYYVLARIHYLAFVNKATQVSVFTDFKEYPPKVAENWQLPDYLYRARTEYAQKLAAEELGYNSASSIPNDKREAYYQLFSQKEKELIVQKWQPEEISQNKLTEHLTAAIDNFKKAIELEPKNGLYYLGLASLYEQYVDYVKEIDLKILPDAFRAIILQQACQIYYTSYQLSINDNLKLKNLPLEGLNSLTGYEAGKAYIRLVEADKTAAQDQKNKSEVLKKNIEKLDKLPRIGVTPIIFSLQTNDSAKELLSRDSQINFDLDGNGITELWPWVKPTTGILVWNEDGKNSITSGRQMFGSVTWWLFFNDGYHALDCLDDNRDGALTVSELKGISVWFDINSNGQSEPSEIKSLDELGIVSISVKSTGTENGWPANKTGMKLKTGQNIATYDWIAKPVDSPAKTVN
jgi:hypothetical protein